MTEPRELSSAALVRLVAGREISARLRDKNFIISSIVIIVVLLGVLGLQVALNSGDDVTKVGVVGEQAGLSAALEAQATALGQTVEVTPYDDEKQARTAVENADVDGAVLPGDPPQLLVEDSASSTLQALVQGAVAQIAVTQQLADAGVTLDVPQVTVSAIDPSADTDGQRVVVAIIGVGMLYGLLILFGQFVAQGVVEEKASRVVELLLAAMKPWQLLAGKIVGLGLLGLAQIVLIAVVGVAGALTFDLVDIPGEVVGTAISVVAWFVLGYALYAAIFATAASLVSRQEDLGTVVMPTTLVLVAAFVIGIQAASDPGGALARITSYLPGLSPLVMPVRMAAGAVAWWEVVLAVALELLAIVLVVRLGGRVYAGALLRTSGKTKIRDALRAERV